MKLKAKPASAVPTELLLNQSLRSAASMLVKTYDSINWKRLGELDGDFVELTFVNARAKEVAMGQFQRMESSCALFVNQECDTIHACFGTVAQRLRQGQDALKQLHQTGNSRQNKEPNCEVHPTKQGQN